MLPCAIQWVIWIEHNNQIFNYMALDFLPLISKIDHMLLSWIYVASYLIKFSVEEDISKIKKSLTFAGSLPLASAPGLLRLVTPTTLSFKGILM